MAHEDLLERIAVDPEVSFGKPTIRGTGIWVGLILGLLAHGMAHEETMAEYSQLSEEAPQGVSRLRRPSYHRPLR